MTKVIKSMGELESRMDRLLEKVFSHPAFLQGVGTVLNLNSYRKLWVNRCLTVAWKSLQLPNKRDQERTLHLINELHHRIAELEEKLAPRKHDTIRVQRAASGPAGSGRKKKIRKDAEIFSIQ